MIEAGDGRLDPAIAATLGDRVGSLRLRAARWIRCADVREFENGQCDGGYVVALFPVTGRLISARGFGS